MKHNIYSIRVAALAIVFAGCNGGGNAGRNADTVTVAGCVQPAQQGIGSNKDQNGVDKFMLTNANVASTAAPATSAPADQAGSDRTRNNASSLPANSPASSEYMLDGKASELRDHLNQQVEITGRLTRDHDQSPSTSGPPDRRPELRVDSVRTIAANCTK